MGLKDDLETDMEVLQQTWKVSTVQTGSEDVPDPEKMGYEEGRKIQAVYLYTDLMNSSRLVKISNSEAAASVIAAFLKVCVRVIKANKGHVRSFDGDRVMGIFAGSARNANAVNAAMQINSVVSGTLNRKVRSRFPSLKSANWELRAMTGLAAGPAFLIRVGIRGTSDMVSVGTAPNLAAALSDLRTRTTHRVAISRGVFEGLRPADLTVGGKELWIGPFSIRMGGDNYRYYRTSHLRSPK